MKEPYWQEFMKNFGMDLQYELKESAQQYKDVNIDEIVAQFSYTDPNMQQQVDQFMGREFYEKIAIVKDRALIVAGADANETIKSLIDKALTSPGPVEPALASSISLLPDPDRRDMIGTFNYIGMLKMMTAIAGKMPFPSNAIKNAKSTSSISWAADINKNSIEGFAIVPKQHIMEIKALFTSVMKQQPQPQGPNDKFPQVPSTPQEPQE